MIYDVQELKLTPGPLPNVVEFGVDGKFASQLGK